MNKIIRFSVARSTVKQLILMYTEHRVASSDFCAVSLARRLMNFKEINLMMISFDDDRISSLLLLSSCARKSREREIKYIMIFITRHDSFNKHL